MKTRILAVLMAMILSVLSVQMIVLAENEGGEDNKVYGDAIVTVSVDNPDCLQLSELEAAEITAVIGLKNDDSFVPLEIPVEAIDMDMEGESAELSFWLGYKEKAIEKAFLDHLSEIQGNLFADMEGETDMSELEDDAEEMLDDASDLLNEITIEFKGLPEHYKLDMEMSSCTIVTSELVKAIVEMVEELLALIYEDINLEELGVKGLLDEILKEEGSSLDELIAELATEDQELAAQVEELFQEIDDTLAYMQSDEFPGVLFVGATVSCDCPVKDYYEIFHEYYKNVDGNLELIGFEFEEYEAYSGTVVKAEDYIKCDYEGVTYEYKGSFDLDVMYEDAYNEYDWSAYELDEGVVDEEFWGLLLRYEIIEEISEEEEENIPAETLPTDIDDQNNEVIITDKNAAPATGDAQNVGFYFVISATALGIILLKFRKKGV